MVATLPNDVLSFHILPRLPAESVLRFMCVSKQWRSFLASDMFKKMHNSYVNDHKNHPKFIVLFEKRRMFDTIGCEAPKNCLVARWRPIPLFKNEGTTKLEILTSYHGLVCVGRKTYDIICGNYSDLFLWNPLTNEYKKLSTNSHKEFLRGIDAFRLYYNSSEDDYKLLHLLYLYDINVFIYSLKSDSWKAVRSRIAFRTIPNWNVVRWSSSTSLNGNLYIASYRTNSSIIKFDTKTEKLTRIEIPFLDNIHDQNSIHASLMVHTGSIHLCFTYKIGPSYSPKTCIELWKMNEDVYWEKVVTYQVDPYDILNLNLKPLHLMSNGNLLMSSNENGEKLYELKVKKKRSKGKGKDKLLTLVSKGICKEVSYSETFVSPNRYSN